MHYYKMPNGLVISLVGFKVVLSRFVNKTNNYKSIFSSADTDKKMYKKYKINAVMHLP